MVVCKLGSAACECHEGQNARNKSTATTTQSTEDNDNNKSIIYYIFAVVIRCGSQCRDVIIGKVGSCAIHVGIVCKVVLPFSDQNGSLS